MDEAARNVRTEFGRRVARRRRLLGLTQREVGAVIGLARSHISLLESGGYASMKFEQLAHLTRILQTSSDYLLQVVEEDPGVIPPRPCPGERPSLDGLPSLLTTTIPQGDSDYA